MQSKQLIKNYKLEKACKAKKEIHPNEKVKNINKIEDNLDRF